MEDFSVRAIVIGVSLFVTMMTLSAIIIYFNTAKGIADEVNKRTDIASSFDNIVNSEDFSDELSGVEVRSLINKYAGVANVKINIILVNGTKTTRHDNINNKDISEEGWLIQTNNYTSIISEEKLNIINPVSNYAVNKVEKLNEKTLEIRLNVKD